MRDKRFYDDPINSDDTRKERLLRLEQEVKRMQTPKPKKQWRYVSADEPGDMKPAQGGGAAPPPPPTDTLPHPLGGAGSPHLGSLTDEQAPQFLKRDGSRTLTGSLAVEHGVTIDGVDLDVLESSVTNHLTNKARVHTQFASAEDASFLVKAAIAALADLATLAEKADWASYADSIDYAKPYEWNGIHTFNKAVLLKGPLGLDSDQLVINNDGTNVDVELQLFRSDGGSFSLFWNGEVGWTTKPFRPFDLIINRISDTEPTETHPGMIWIKPND